MGRASEVELDHNATSGIVADPGAVPQLRIRRMMLDAADHRRLAEFYRRLLGAQYESGSEPGQEDEPRFLDLIDPATGARLGFQVSENYRPPDWPDHHRVPTQGHLDLTVLTGELDRAIDFAVSLGARVLSTEERDDGMVVLADPAGHPFCFLTAGTFGDVSSRGEYEMFRLG